MIKTHSSKLFLDPVQNHQSQLTFPSCIKIFKNCMQTKVHWKMAQLQMSEKPLHCGYSIEKGTAIISDHHHRLSQSNVVSIDIGWKVVSVGSCC